MNRRVDFVRVLGTIYRWARRRRLIDCPPPTVPRLPRKLRRDKIPTAEEMEAILRAIRSPEFRDLARFVALTGCRPSEAAAIEARHVEGDVVVLDEYKTRRRTGDVRAIVLNEPAREIVGRLVTLRPEGPIFRNRAGRP
ncbi:hypothetical protein [Tautonia marina]|uniref:hypothetical protein n=1 Tax=Tautonia marina TaxID=2653855 RepID=UPI0012612B8C|nr:hypothetical protein [Tautonia marina]